MPKKMILPIAFIIVTFGYIVKSFYDSYLADENGNEQQQAQSIEEIEKQREYDRKLQACLKQQNEYQEDLEAKGQLYSVENGQQTDNSFKLLSDECKMMVIRWEKESDAQPGKQQENTPIN